MRWVLVTIALGACGRIYFDPIGDRGDGGTDSTGAIDAGIDAPPLACTTDGLSCPAPLATTCGATCYATCIATVTWAEAQDICLAWGGNLARPDVATEIPCLAGDINDAWIGLVQDAAATSPSASWRWTHGGPIGFTAWATAQPDDLDDLEDGEEQCGLFSASTWVDDTCTAMKNVACSRPAP